MPKNTHSLKHTRTPPPPSNPRQRRDVTTPTTIMRNKHSTQHGLWSMDYKIHQNKFTTQRMLPFLNQRLALLTSQSHPDLLGIADHLELNPIQMFSPILTQPKLSWLK